MYFRNCGSNSAFLRWQLSINVARWTVLLSLCTSWMTSLESTDMLAFYRAFPIFCPPRPSLPEYSLLEALAWTCAQDCNDSKILAPFLQSYHLDLWVEFFQTFSRRLLGLHNACINSSVDVRFTTNFLALTTSDLARHWCFHRYFFFRAFLHGFLEFRIFQIGKINASQHPCIVKIRFSARPFLLFFPLSCLWHVWPNLWPQMICPWCCLPSCQPPDHVYPSGCVPLNSGNRVNLVHASDRSRSSSRHSCETSKAVCVTLVTSMYRNWKWFFFRHIELDPWVYVMTPV